MGKRSPLQKLGKAVKSYPPEKDETIVTKSFTHSQYLQLVICILPLVVDIIKKSISSYQIFNHIKILNKFFVSVYLPITKEN
jgi:hypothetical protein